jgi:hypothetical protein
MELELESPAVHAILEEVRRIYDLEEDNRCDTIGILGEVDSPGEIMREPADRGGWWMRGKGARTLI